METNTPDNAVPEYTVQDGFMFTLESGEHTYFFFETLSRPRHHPQDELITGIEDWELRQILQECAESASSLETLARLYDPITTTPYIFSRKNRDTSTLIDQAADRLHAPRIIRQDRFLYARLAQEREARQKQDVQNMIRQQATENNTLIPEEKAWILFKILVDKTDEPVSNMRFEITLPDQSKKKVKTNTHGIILMKNIDPGSCDLTCNINKESLTYLNTFGFLGTGASMITPDSDDTIYATCEKNQYRNQEKKNNSFLVNLVEHPISPGESLKKIANQYGLTHKELLEFNWGAANHDKIQYHVEYDTGCLARDEASDDYIFNENGKKEPDTIYAYKKWRQSGYATNQEHIIRVEQAGYDIRIHFRHDINPNRYSEDEYDSKADTLYLETNDKKWSYSAKVKDLGDFDQDWVEIVYPRPPLDTKLSLIQDPEDENEEPFYVFHDLMLNDILKTLDQD